MTTEWCSGVEYRKIIRESKAVKKLEYFRRRTH